MHPCAILHVITGFETTIHEQINVIISAVTLPDGVLPGDVIHVRAPDGRINAITVPEGMGPGSTFTVEFADDLPPPPEEDLTPGVYVPTVTAQPEVANGSAAVASGGNGEVVASATTGPYVPAYK